MDNQPPIDPNQPQPQNVDRSQPVFQPRATPAPPRSYPVPPTPRPTFSPPPGYQALNPAPDQPRPDPYQQPQILPPPVIVGQPSPFAQPPQQPVPPATTFQPPSLPPAKKTKFKWLLGGLLIVIVLGLAASFGLRTWQALPTKAPQKVSDQFISDLQKDDPADAYGLTSASYQKTYSDAYFKKIVDQVSSGLQGQVSVTGRKVTKTTPPQAVLVYKVTTQYTPQYIKVTLENTDSWQVTSFAASTLPPAVTPTK